MQCSATCQLLNRQEIGQLWAVFWAPLPDPEPINSLNTNKSNALFISPKQNIPPPEINVNCPLGIIKSVNKAKYLGINLDNKLNFRNHIKLIEMKIARSVGILNKLKHYLNKPSLKKLYHSLISSHINYGLLVWGTTYPSYLTKLIKLQNKAIRIVNKVIG